MQFISFYRAAPGAAAANPTPEFMARMTALVEEQVKAGKLLFSGGFMGADDGMIVKLAGGDISVGGGAKGETTHLGGGFAIMRADSREELLEQVERFLRVAGDGECVIRRLMDGPPEIR